MNIKIKSNRLHGGLLLGAALMNLSTTAMAQDESLRVYPSSLAQDVPFVVDFTELDPCLISASSIETYTNQLDYEIRLVNDGDIICSGVFEPRRFTLGMFRLDETQNSNDVQIRVTLQSGMNTTPVLLHERTVDIVQSAEQIEYQRPSSGTWWTGRPSGNGFTLESNAQYAFLTAYTFDSNGDSQWFTAQGDMNGPTLDSEFLSFEDGVCLFCGQGGSPRQTPVAYDMSIVFADTGEAFLSLWDQPFNLQPLRRFALSEIQFSTSLDGSGLRMPNLNGQWIFTDKTSGDFHRMVDLTAVALKQRNSELFFEDVNSGFTLRCASEETAGLTFNCEMLADGQFMASFNQNNVTHDRIESDQFIGVRLD